MTGKLFSPIRIGALEVKNRIVQPAMVTHQAGPENMVTEGHIQWYGARARGGVGLIIVELTPVARGGEGGPGELAVWDDRFIPGFRELVRAVHAYGTKIFLQLCHAGRQTSKMYAGQQPAAPSAIPCPLYEPNYHEVPHELSIPEIEQIVGQFASAARRTREAGFDGLEIHGAHGYLVAEFMSAYSNRRHDAYGGDWRARLKFPLEVIRSVRREVGSDFPICFRFSGNEFVPDGRTIEEAKRIAPIIEAAGVDCLHVSGGVYESFWATIQPNEIREGFLADDAAAVKQMVGIPVIAVGRIKSPELAEEILQQGKADMVALGRQLICDPDWATKVRAGDLEDIRPCISCTQGCINRGIVQRVEAGCIYNTAAGREKEAEITPAGTPKKVMVIGGGPGGMEAARVAALRGHQVTLLEKEGKLGGRFNLARIAPFQQEYALPVKWFEGQLNKLGVKVDLGREATPELIAQINPDAVIIATGGVPQIPDIPGADKKILVTAEDILAGKANMGTNVVVLGGELVVCDYVAGDVADYLAQRGKKVTLAVPGPALRLPLIPGQLRLLRWRSYGVKILTGASVRRINDDGVTVSVAGKEQTISGVDQVILAVGVKPVNGLVKKLEGKVAEMYVIGDAKEPRTVFESTHEGAEAARKI